MFQHIAEFYNYLGQLIVTAAVYRGLASLLWTEALTTPRNLPAPGRRQPLYVVLTTSQRPVFLVNSRLNLFTAAPSGSTGSEERLHPTGAPLIPKLRGDFAEFLNEGYLDHLSILYLPTCVGFGTGTRFLPRAFSRRHGVGNSPA